MAHGDLVGAKNGRNHLISHNPKSTQCGQFSPAGWGPANEGGKLCLKCENGGHQGARPLPNTFNGTRRP